MHAKILIASMVGMAIVTRIKNEYLRASLGIPIVAFIMFMLLSMSVSAQWKPDRPDYEVVRDGNFYMLTSSRAEAIDICLRTLDYNGAKMRTVKVKKDDPFSPIFTYFSHDDGMVYIVYVTKTKSNDYVICFRYQEDKPTDFVEAYATFKYEGLD
jgi:hypothetical protein